MKNVHSEWHPTHAVEIGIAIALQIAIAMSLEYKKFEAHHFSIDTLIG